jgi:hypothetical protein
VSSKYCILIRIWSSTKQIIAIYVPSKFCIRMYTCTCMRVRACVCVCWYIYPHDQMFEWHIRDLGPDNFMGGYEYFFDQGSQVFSWIPSNCKFWPLIYPIPQDASALYTYLFHFGCLAFFLDVVDIRSIQYIYISIYMERTLLLRVANAIENDSRFRDC